MSSLTRTTYYTNNVANSYLLYLSLSLSLYIYIDIDIDIYIYIDIDIINLLGNYPSMNHQLKKQSDTFFLSDVC